MDAGNITLELATLKDMCEELRRRGHAAIVAISKPCNPDEHPEIVGQFEFVHDAFIMAEDRDEGVCLAQHISNITKAS